MPPTATPCEQAGEATPTPEDQRQQIYQNGVQQGRWEARHEHESTCKLHQLEESKLRVAAINRQITELHQEKAVIKIEQDRLQSLIRLALD